MSSLKSKREVSVEIDKLTNSIENAISGDVFDTELHRLTKKDLKQIKKGDWVFDWSVEILNSELEVYKLTIKENKEVIQGLISLRVKPDHIFVELVESAKFNRGKNKLYVGVSGNLFAFACKCSRDLGFEGFVSFIAKTVLIKHYEELLGASMVNGQRMFIDDYAASKLIVRYFKE